MFKKIYKMMDEKDNGKNDMFKNIGVKKDTSNNRFEVLSSEILNYDTTLYIIKDKITGVLYLQNHITNGGGLTPLLDKNGKPVTELISNESNSNKEQGDVLSE